MKKFLFYLLTLLLSANSSVYSNTGYNRNNKAERLLSNESGEILYVNKEACIENFVEKYDFFIDTSFSNDIILANTTVDITDYSINAIKVVLNPRLYYLNNEMLNSYDNIVEFSFLNSENIFTKKYYSMNHEEKNEVLKKTKIINESDNFHQTFVTLYNLENDYKSKIHQIVPFSTIRKSGSVNNQGVLNNYLESAANLQVGMHDIGNSGITQEFVHVIDNPIVNLIPKDIFKYNGINKKSGSEWGYVANTYSDTGNNKITSLIVYDIENQRLGFNSADNTVIKPVITRNFKYNSDLDLVYDDGPNNYCLGNPNYRVNISYTTVKDDLNSTSHPNVGDSNYDIKLDNGVCINRFNQMLVGSGKNSDGKVGLVKFLLKTFNLLTQMATAKIPMVPGIVDKVFTTISDAYESGETYKNLLNYSLTNRADNRKQYFYEYNANANNFQSAKISLDEEKFFKSFSLKFPEYKDKAEDITAENFAKNNRQTPLLFKTKDDFLNYEFMILEAENFNGYTCLVEHSLDLDVFNDNSVWLFRWDPEFICESKNNWSYLYGSNMKFNERTIEGGEMHAYLCGKGEIREFAFGPAKKSGNFTMILNDASANTIFTTNQVSKTVEKNYYSDSSNNLHDSSYSKPLRYDFSLCSGDVFKFSISRIISGSKQFGWGNITISELGSSTSIYGNYVERMNLERTELDINNGSILTTLITSKSDFYTINLISKKNYLDTFLRIYDEHYNLIIEDDDGFGGGRAGVKVTLFKNKKYYIISRFYNKSDGKAEIVVTNEKYIPEIAEVLSKNALNDSSFGKDKYASFLISQYSDRNIVIQAEWYNTSLNINPTVKGIIYDCYGKIIKKVDDLARTNLNITFEKDYLYYLELSTTNEALNGMGLSIRFKNI